MLSWFLLHYVLNKYTLFGIRLLLTFPPKTGPKIGVRSTPEEVEENLMKSNYDNYDYFKGYSQVKCSGCEGVIIDLS